MELPPVIVVGATRYRVVEMTEEERDHVGHGVCNPAMGLIKIDMKQCDDQLLETLLHEVGHAVCSTAAITDHASQEDYILRTTPIWMQVWRENLRLMTMLGDYARQPVSMPFNM